MAYVIVPSSPVYFGLSTDPMPPFSALSDGQQLIQTDTGYRFYKAPGGWVRQYADLKDLSDTVVGLQRAIEFATPTPANLSAMTDMVQSLERIRLQGDSAVLLPSAGYSSRLPFTRPANVTQYTAQDSVGGVLYFPKMGPANGRILLTSAELELDIASVPITATMTTLVLHLYNGSPPSAYADNAAWDVAAQDRPYYLGSFTFLTPVDLGSTLYSQADSLNIQRQLGPQGDLYGYLVTTIGFTPAANSEVYVVTLHSMAL